MKVALVRWSTAYFYRLNALLSLLVYVPFAVMESAAIATIGHLALSVGPASLIVPLVATSPSLAGLLGVVVLREPSTRRQIAAIALGLVAAVVLAIG